ncbi:Peptidase family S49 [Chitinophaga ginsengisegetis]|uniref:Peptidase family S49 n=2 Tax=Chitinophaga ginsengisegetis TaxID=393003 RepID=A0A1T5PBP5_9BACT|nr:Peptidase family S49 [Chitinophaga ginsengisegetis]
MLSRHFCAMTSNFHILSAILNGPWLITPDYAQAMLPWVASLYSGSGSVAAVPRSGYSSERPFIVAPRTGKRYEWNDTPPEGSVAVIPITGPITKYNGGCGEPGSIQRQSLVAEVDARSEIVGALYLYDTPGGQVSGTSSLANAIRNAKKRSVAYVDDGIAASAGMWFLSASAEAYVSQKTDQVGSIGAYTSLVNFSGYFEKLGIKIQEIYAPQSTDKNGSYRAAIEGNEDLIKQDLSVVVDGFINFVADRSPRARASIDKWSTGKMFHAADAKKYGLHEGVLPMRGAIQRVVALNKNSTPTISSNTKHTTMAFEQTLSAAQAEEFEVVEGGFLATEDQLNNVEAHITGLQSQLSASQETVTAQGQQIEQLQTAATASESTIQRLQTELKNKGKRDAVTFTNPEVGVEDDAEVKEDRYADLRKAAFPNWQG